MSSSEKEDRQILDDEEKCIEKKIRKRKRKRYKIIREQMEFYFSDSNLSKDKFMSSTLAQAEDGYVDLNIFLKFNKIRSLTMSLCELAKALSSSEILEVDETMQKVRRTTTIQQRNDFDESTIYVENIPPYCDHEWLKNIFSSYGQVTYVNLPKYKTTNQNKGFAFVEFDSPKSAWLACEHFGASVDEFKELKLDSDIIGRNRKRSRSPSFTHTIDDDEDDDDNDGEDEEIPQKKRKLNEQTSVEMLGLEDKSNQNEIEMGKSKQKKKRKRQKKSKEKLNAETKQLRVLSKLQWKSLRNRYLALQKDNMASLKKSLMLLNQNLPEYNELMPSKNADDETNSSGTIIRLIPMKEITDVKHFKEIASTIAKVVYIDNHSSEDETFIRCINSANAIRLLQSDFLQRCGEASLLKDEEEKSYLNKIEDDRKTKYNLKTRPKIRGREKLIARVEQLLEKPKPKHIRFDD